MEFVGHPLHTGMLVRLLVRELLPGSPGSSPGGSPGGREGRTGLWGGSTLPGDHWAGGLLAEWCNMPREGIKGVRGRQAKAPPADVERVGQGLGQGLG